jgi:hypothetical protein
MKRIFFSIFLSAFCFLLWLTRRNKILLALLCLGGLHVSIAEAIEVGGLITEDTTWSPDNNPYHVINDIKVQPGVTLTILPGTNIKIQCSRLTSWQDFHQYFSCSGYHHTKMFRVEGQIIAEGTEENPILFTHDVDDYDYYWGVIYLTEDADFCSFSHCRFEYSCSMTITVGRIAKGAIASYNGQCRVNNCDFFTNVSNITVYTPCKTVEIVDNTFDISGNMGSFPQTFLGEQLTITSPAAGYKRPLVAHNTFLKRNVSYITSVDVVYNMFQNTGGLFFCNGSNAIRYFYGNDFINCNTGIYNGATGDSLYVKKNRFIGGWYGLDIEYCYIDIQDNCFENNIMITNHNYGIVANNIINAGEMVAGWDISVYNNIVHNVPSCGLRTGYSLNCISFNNKYITNGADVFYVNCVNLLSDELSFNPPQGNPVFRNCIIDFPLDPPFVDGGGNIIVDSLQAQQIFEDAQNGDFHLTPGSIAIDAGLDTLGYYNPFDLDHHHRVWDGDGDGNAVIDIGAYEYGAPEFGKICGYITETTSGEPVNYVQIKVNNQPGEFTYADSSGYFEIQLVDGVYDLYAQRVFYEDAVVYSVTVENGLSSEVDFNMSYNDPMVSAGHNEIPIPSIFISNYPNPFNPSTEIRFQLSDASQLEHTQIEIFNTKGQKVRELKADMSSRPIRQQPERGDISYSITWDGTDSANQPVSSGVYLYQLRVGKQTLAQNKMMLLK